MSQIIATSAGGILVRPGALPQAPASGHEARGAERYTVLLRTAKLIENGREYLCVLRDVSATGVKLRVFHQLPRGDLLLELNDGQRFAIEPVWFDGEHAGCRFAAPVDVRRFLETGDDPYNRRKVRLNVSKMALLVVRGQQFEVRLASLSGHGAGIESDVPLMKFEPVRLEIERMPLLYGKVCWAEPPRYGLVFDFGFRLEQLAAHVAALQGLSAA